MAERTLETDYLVVGAGAAAMAFADTLLEDSDASMTIVARAAALAGRVAARYLLGDDRPRDARAHDRQQRDPRALEPGNQAGRVEALGAARERALNPKPEPVRRRP